MKINGENGEYIYIYIAGVDNDSVLVMQNDSVICHPINIDLYRKYSMPMLAEDGWTGFGSIHPYIQNTNMCRLLKQIQMWTQYNIPG